MFRVVSLLLSATFWLAVLVGGTGLPPSAGAQSAAGRAAGARSDGPFVAYSLREARRLHESGVASPELRELGGMTSIAGMVYAEDGAVGGSGEDLILVGQVDASRPSVTLDDFVVAIRSLLVHDAWPLVSIDRTPETGTTGRQRVRFEGGIANTRFGKDLLDADVALKKLALGLPGEPTATKSYFALAAQRAARGEQDESVAARFWFYPLSPSLATRDGVFVVKELRVGARTQVLDVGERTVDGDSAVRDAVGDEFAAALTDHYDDLAAAQPEIGRLKVLFDLVALANGLQSLPNRPDLDYWLRAYQVASVETPADYPLLERKEAVRTAAGERALAVEGGVEVRALALRLQDGDVTALREAVLKSRPDPRALTWRVPIQGWRVTGGAGSEATGGAPTGKTSTVTDDGAADPGTSVSRRLTDVTPGLSSSLMPSLPGLPTGLPGSPTESATVSSWAWPGGSGAWSSPAVSSLRSLASPPEAFVGPTSWRPLGSSLSSPMVSSVSSMSAMGASAGSSTGSSIRSSLGSSLDGIPGSASARGSSSAWALAASRLRSSASSLYVESGLSDLASSAPSLLRQTTGSGPSGWQLPGGTVDTWRGLPGAGGLTSGSPYQVGGAGRSLTTPIYPSGIGAGSPTRTFSAPSAPSSPPRITTGSWR